MVEASDSLSVRNFSCLEHVSISFARYVLLIGPQASGKSVTAKLAYFLISSVYPITSIIREDKTIAEFEEGIKERFIKNFPESAWGDKQFEIKLVLGNVQVLLKRTKAKTLSKSIRVVLSMRFLEIIEEARALMKRVKEEIVARKDVDANFAALFMRIEVESSIHAFLKEKIASRYFVPQHFIPAGRTFFTSTQKMLTAYEALANVDPITIQFGKMFADSIASNRIFISPRRDEKKQAVTERLRKEVQNEMLGGEIEEKNDIEYLRTSDRRLVPLTHLSSGQQELMPLLRVIDFLAKNSQSLGMIYIEEPETHLFPEAQSKIVSYLFSLMTESPEDTLFITTHSPYVLSHINNLIKAGQILENDKLEMQAQIEKIFGDKSSIGSTQIRSYSISEGRTHPIIDDDGFVSTDYIDSVSEHLADRYQKLVDLQVSQSK